MRIVAGKHRGRRLAVPPGHGVRPTSERAREALFNILSHGLGGHTSGASPLVGARVLDAFAGSGALGLEALSRGAGEAIFMEQDPDALRALRRNVQTLGAADRVRILDTDVLAPPYAREPCTLGFLDPPYGRDLAVPALLALTRSGWLSLGSIVTIEQAAGTAFAVPEGFAVLDERRYGKACLVLLEAVSAPAE